MQGVGVRLTLPGHADAYNQSIKENYANSQKDSATARATTKSEPEQKTVSDYADKPREAEKYWYCGVSFTDMPHLLPTSKWKS